MNSIGRAAVWGARYGVTVLLLCAGQPSTAADLHLWVLAPATNEVTQKCPDLDSLGNYAVGTALTDLAQINIYSLRFSAPTDTLKLALTGLAGREGDSLAFDITGIAPGTMGRSWSTALDAAGNESCIGGQTVWALPATAPPSPSAGLLATYYDNMDLTGASVAATDSLIDFACGNWPMSVAPIPSGTIGPGHFSVRWSGFVTVASAGTWTFCVDSDDGAKLWVDGQVVVDKWTTLGQVKACGTIGLATGTYPIQLEYQQNGGGCLARLLWTAPGGIEQVTPAAELSH